MNSRLLSNQISPQGDILMNTSEATEDPYEFFSLAIHPHRLN